MITSSTTSSYLQKIPRSLSLQIISYLDDDCNIKTAMTCKDLFAAGIIHSNHEKKYFENKIVEIISASISIGLSISLISQISQILRSPSLTSETCLSSSRAFSELEVEFLLIFTHISEETRRALRKKIAPTYRFESFLLPQRALLNRILQDSGSRMSLDDIIAFPKHRTVQLFISSEANSNLARLAISIIVNITHKNDWPNIIKDIVDTLLYNKNVSKVIKITQRLSVGYYRSMMQTYIVEKISSLGHLDKALVIAREITSAYPRDQALIIIALSFVSEAHIDRALSIVPEITDKFERRRILRAISLKLVALGLVDRALAVARGISPRGQRDQVVLKAVALSFVSEAHIDRALSIVPEITNKSERSTILRAISLKLLSLGRINRRFVVITREIIYDFFT